MFKYEIENKLKSLPYVKDYHIEKLNLNSTRAISTTNINRFKVRVWIVENLYVANLLLGNPKIEDVMKSMSSGNSIMLDIFYTK